jgi:hypothetical protein
MQSRVGSNLWQAIQLIEFIFLFSVPGPFVCLNLTLVRNFCMKFCKRNDSLVNWNEIKDCFMSHMS